MWPMLFEIPRPTLLASVVIVAALTALAAAIEIWEQRRNGVYPDVARLIGISLVGALAGFALSRALTRWGPLQVRSWGTMLMFGFVAGMLWAMWASRDDDEFTPDGIVDLTLVILVGAVIGARLMWVALEWGDQIESLAHVAHVWEGGMSFHGGLLGGIIGAIALLRRRGLSVLKAMDLLAPSVTLGYAITRIGCFLNGCCYGHPTDSVFGVVFHHLPNGDDPAIPRHPTQLYAAAAGLLIFVLLLLLRRHIRRRGHLFGTYLILYSVARFVVEEFRRGATGEIFLPLAPLTKAQVASIAIALLIGGLMARDWLRAPDPPPPA